MKRISIILIILTLFCNLSMAQDTLNKYYNAFSWLTPFHTTVELVPERNTDRLRLMIIKVATIDTSMKITFSNLPADSICLLDKLKYVAHDSVLYDSSGKLAYADKQNYVYTNQGIEVSSLQNPQLLNKYYIKNSDVVKIAWGNDVEYIRYSKEHYPKKNIYWKNGVKYVDRYWVQKEYNTIQIKRKRGKDGHISVYTFLKDGQLITQKDYDDPKGYCNQTINTFFYDAKNHKYFMVHSLSFSSGSDPAQASDESKIYKYIDLNGKRFVSEIITYSGINIFSYKTKIIYNDRDKPRYMIYEPFDWEKLSGGIVYKYEYYYW